MLPGFHIIIIKLARQLVVYNWISGVLPGFHIIILKLSSLAWVNFAYVAHSCLIIMIF